MEVGIVKRYEGRLPLARCLPALTLALSPSRSVVATDVIGAAGGRGGRGVTDDPPAVGDRCAREVEMMGCTHLTDEVHAKAEVRAPLRVAAKCVHGSP